MKDFRGEHGQDNSKKGCADCAGLSIAKRSKRKKNVPYVYTSCV